MNPTKALPPAPGPILERERLMSKLVAWEDRKLVMIHGQAGQGKSTLAAEYVRALAGSAVWYTMDREDDNPAVFLSGLGSAVQRACSGRVPRPAPPSQNQYGLDGIRQGVSKWLGHVLGGLPQQSLIVFDDYSSASSPAVRNHLFKTLFDSSPPHVRFMIIGRGRPDLEIAKLRAQQAVGEITGDDLKFSDDEAHDLLSAVFGMQIGRREAAHINRAAEGWPAGLVLMHEYLASAPSHARDAVLSGRRFPGFQDHAFDYLAQEVFSHLSPDMQRFLLRTSVADYLPAPLMALLSGLPSVADMVEQLRKRNLFITAVDEGASVVRYHAVFREFLQKKLLSETRPAEVRRLYSLAANYFTKSGDVVRSVDLCLASRQVEKAVGRIESCGREMLASGRANTLLRWIESLPKEYERRPWLLFFRAVARRYTDPRIALSLFDRALAGFRLERRAAQRLRGRMFSLCGIIEAYFHSGGNFKRMAKAAAVASGLLKRSRNAPSEARARLLLAVGTAYFFIGRLREGAAALSRALDLFRKIGDYFYQIHTAIYLAPCSIYLGDFPRARETLRKGFEALKSIPDEVGGEAALHISRAMTALFEGKFDEAQESIDRCNHLSREYGLEAVDFLSLDIGGWLKAAVGDFESAELLLRECKRKGEELGKPFFSASGGHLLSNAYLLQNKLDKALSESAPAYAVRERAGSKLFSTVSLATIGAIHAKLGRPGRAERELKRALTTFRQIGAAQQEASVLLALAMLCLKKKKEDEALKHLHAGFRIGQERGFTYYPLQSAAELRPLAERAMKHGVCAGYCASLVQDRAPAASLKIYCLGGFKVIRGQALIPDAEWKGKRTKTLLKLLAAHEGQKLSRDTLVELLWPGARADSCRQTFSTLLHRLRKVLEPGPVVPEGDGFGPCITQDDDLLFLNRDTVWTDVREFLSSLDDAGRMMKKQEHAKAVKHHEKAFDLYQGDFLPDDVYEDWAAPARERLRGLYLKALEQAGELAEKLGEKDKALIFSERLFSADPCNEKACRWLMTRRLSDGRRGEAIRTFERCQRALSRELDAEPDELTAKLYRRIIGG